MNSQIPPPFPGAPSPYGSIYPPPPQLRPKMPHYWIPIALSVLIAIVILVAVVGRSVYVGSQSANIAIEQLHRTMATQDWDKLYAESDEKYRAAMTPEASQDLFAGIARKLGAPVSTRQTGTQVQTNFSGKYLIANFETEFSLDAKGTEKVTWRQSGGIYRLVGYNIESSALISR